jgi:hypothetical protein
LIGWCGFSVMVDTWVGLNRLDYDSRLMGLFSGHNCFWVLVLHFDYVDLLLGEWPYDICVRLFMVMVLEVRTMY